MLSTSVTNQYTVSKLIFIGPRDMVCYQFSAHRSDKRPRLSAKAKQAKYRFIKSKIVCSTESRTMAHALFQRLFSAHRMDRLCINISRKCSLQDSVVQTETFNNDDTTLSIRSREVPENVREAQTHYMKSILSTPWIHPRVKGSVSQNILWSKADEVYAHWLTVEGVSRKGGYRAINTVFTNRLGFPVDVYAMLKHFKKGWTPHSDLHWQTYYN